MGFWCWPPNAIGYHNYVDVRIANGNTKKILKDIPFSFAPRDLGAWTGDIFGRSLWLWAKRYSKKHQMWPGVAHDSRSCRVSDCFCTSRSTAWLYASLCPLNSGDVRLCHHLHQSSLKTKIRPKHLYLPKKKKVNKFHFSSQAESRCIEPIPGK